MCVCTGVPITTQGADAIAARINSAVEEIHVISFACVCVCVYDECVLTPVRVSYRLSFAFGHSEESSCCFVQYTKPSCVESFWYECISVCVCVCVCVFIVFFVSYSHVHHILTDNWLENSAVYPLAAALKHTPQLRRLVVGC